MRMCFISCIFIPAKNILNIHTIIQNILENIFAAAALPTILATWQRNQFLILALSVAANSAAATSDVVHQ
jgi:hypothetical protein